MKRPDLDVYENAVYEFIKKNEECSENYVRKEMNQYPELTIRRKIKSLIEKGVIEDRKVGSRMHKLCVTDRTTFAKIDKMLQKIEEEIDSFDNPVSKINDMALQKLLIPQAFFLKQKFVFPYIETIATILRVLYMKETGISKVDAQALHEKNIRLFRKLTLQTIAMKTEKDILANCRRLFQEALDFMSDSPQLSEYLFDRITFKKLIKISEDFEKEHLD